MSTTTTETTRAAQDPARTIQEQNALLRRRYAEAVAGAEAALAAVKAELGDALTGVYGYLAAHAPAHPLVAALIPQVRQVVELYRADHYEAAFRQLAAVDATIAALHELEPAIPARR